MLAQLVSLAAEHRAGANAAEAVNQQCAAARKLGRIKAEFVSQLHSEKLGSLKQLAYGASHEINNPLANIASRAQTLMTDEENPERRRRLSAINQQAFRAHEMIADLMLFAHPPQPELGTVSLVPVLEKVIAEIEPLAAEQETVICCEFESSPVVIADSTQLAVAVKAVLINALQAVAQSGQIKIVIDAIHSSTQAVISIADTGPGIAAEHQPHLFDPFFSGREAGRGLGFGLCKAYRIMELHGGNISAENTPHGGALFRLSLPYANVNVDENCLSFGTGA